MLDYDQVCQVIKTYRATAFRNESLERFFQLRQLKLLQLVNDTHVLLSLGTLTGGLIPWRLSRDNCSLYASHLVCG